MQAEPLLEPLVLTGKYPGVRAAVVDALAMLCFVGSEGAAETLHTMHKLWRVVLGGAPNAGAAGAARGCMAGVLGCMHALELQHRG